MTCGACSPESFRTVKGMRIYGYIVSDDLDQVTLMAQRLHYMGAERVIADYPMGERQHYNTLSRFIRKGDTLILADNDCLDENAIADLEDAGVGVNVLKPEYFVD